MRILRARTIGMCFGVRDALEVARTVERPTEITVHGELVHNPKVVDELRRRGFVQQAERGRDVVPESARVLITAHGVSERERAQLRAAGKELIDTTCPLVRKAHTAAVELDRAGYHVLVVGKRAHVEVRGLTGDLRSWDVLEMLADVRDFAQPRLGIIAQTTTLEADFAAFAGAVRFLNPQAEIKCVDTICQPTKDRQRALEELLEEVEAMVVVGGRQSNNTRKLVTTCQDFGVPAFHVEGAGELREAWFAGMEAVGIAAGTSTLTETIDEVEARLLVLARPMWMRAAS